jgi:hypothetical protein
MLSTPGGCPVSNDSLPPPCVSSSPISAAAERAELLHILAKILEKGLVKACHMNLDSGSLKR